MKFFKGTQFLVIFLGCIFLVNIQFDEKCDFWSSEAHLRIQLQIAEHFQLESKVWKAAGKGGATPTTKIQHSLLLLFVLEVKVKCFTLGQRDYSRFQEKRRQKEEAAFCCV